MNKSRTLKTVDSEQFLTADEAAQKLGIKTTAIRNYLTAGKLTTYKFKSLTLLKADEVEGWKDRQRKR